MKTNSIAPALAPLLSPSGRPSSDRDGRISRTQRPLSSHLPGAAAEEGGCEPILVSGLTYIGRHRNLYSFVA
ncbi:hypothetical protein [Porphyromonas sp.]